MKKNNLILTLFLLISLVISSCKQERNLFTLEANLTNISDGTLFTLKSLKTGSNIDSSYVVNGHISLKSLLKSKHPEKLFLSATDSISKEFIYTFLLVKNEQVTFKADKKDFPWNIDASGSVHQDKAENFNQLIYQRQEIAKKLNRIYSSEKELLSEKRTEARDSLDNATITLIKKEFNSYAALDNFKYYKTKFSTEELSSLYSKLDTELKETAMGKAIKLQSEFPNPKIGDKYYDYRAITQNGDSLSLSDIKNKYILLHFSSLACNGSKLSLPDLKEMYDTHGDSLEIISISTDVNKEQWQNHVKRDSIPWTYLWDGKASFNDAVVKYWEIGTPNYVLISPDKIILERWLGYRDGLIEEKLKKYLNNE